MGNWFAYFALAIWPLISLYLYRVKKVEIATIITMLWGFLLLPVKTDIDLSLIPPLGKETIPVLCCIVGTLFVSRKKIGVFNLRGAARVFFLGLLFIPFATVATNTESLNIGERVLPGLTYHDAFSMIVNQILYVVPFFIGRAILTSHESQLLLFRHIVIAALIYSILILFEVRMSPQLHEWVYGYFPHEFFSQQIRFGGFRPVVFLGSGLKVSFFIVVCLICSIVLWKNKIRISLFKNSIIFYYLAVILILCKSVASIIYGFFSVIIFRLFSLKSIVKIALFLSFLSVLYPALRITDLFPVNELYKTAESFNKNRAQSLEFRFQNEDKLLTHARSKINFGWGGWGRNRVYDKYGKDISVTDGTWIIKFGEFGWIGFACYFGLMFVSVYRANKVINLTPDKLEQLTLAAHALIVSLILVDQLPNSSLVPWYWLMIGSLYGRCERIAKDSAITKNTHNVSI